MAPRKPKLTAAEKKARKAEKKRLQRLANEEAKRQVKRDGLARELELGRVNRLKLESIWRQTLLDIKEPILRTEYQVVINNLEMLLDAKDFSISYLLDELDEAEQQYRTRVRAHCERIEDFINIFQERLDDLKRKYDEEINNLLQATDIEIEKSLHKQNDEIEYLQIMMYGLDSEEKNMVKTIRSEYMSKLNEETNKNTAELQHMRGSRESGFEELWNTYKLTLNNYTQGTADRRKEYDILHKHDGWMRNKIKEQYAQIADSYDMIKRLKERQLVEKDTVQVQIKDLDEEMEFFTKHFTVLKNANSHNIEFDNQQLELLVLVSNKAVTFLSGLRDKAEEILRVISMCRKYETKREQVLAFPKSLPDIELSSRHQIQHATVYKELEPFWQKCGQINASRYILKEELKNCAEKNKFFRKQIQLICNYSLLGCSAMKEY